MIRLLCAFLAMLVAALPVRAGDTASLEILGFSPDGSVFAFEEYGIQDGSGFPYSHRFYVDTAKDAFLPGTPIRVRLDDEGASLKEARETARAKGEDIIADDALRAHRGFTAGFNAVTELSADPHRMVVNPRAVFPPIDDPLELRLEEIPFPAPSSCDGLGQPHMGFRLVRIDAAPDGAPALLHEDESVPESRRCPNGYRIGAVQTFFPNDGPAIFVVLIAVRSFGFEGPDHRWIAIPGQL